MRAILSGFVFFALAVAGAAQTSGRFGDGGAPPFYAWSGEIPAPGTLLRSEPLPAALVLPAAARGARILYASTDGVDGKSRIAVSGALFWPKGETPAGGWPIVAWAHGTVGAADRCAPSLAGRSERDVKYLDAWLSNGFAVVATDYQGLGTPGGHPYLATRPEAYGVLDSVRAVRGRDGVGDRTIIVGQSQGAGAAFATAAFQPKYAPDVKLLGTVATGVPFFSKETLAALARGANPDAVRPTLAYTFLMLQLAEMAAPNFKSDDYLTQKGREIYELTRTSCLRGIAKAIVDGNVSQRVAFSQSVTPVINTLFPLLAYPGLKVEQPLFVGTGEADRDVPPSMQEALVRRACAAGSRVVWRRYPGHDHSATVNASLADSAPFVKGLLAGAEQPSTCDALPKAQ